MVLFVVYLKCTSFNWPNGFICSVFEVYDYMGLVDYGDDDEDYQEEGGKLAEAAELLADEGKKQKKCFPPHSPQLL